jgi:PEP-CTERM motif
MDGCVHVKINPVNPEKITHNPTSIMQIKRLISSLTLSSVAIFSAASLRADVFALWGNSNTSTMATPTTVDSSVLTAGNLTGVNLTAGNPVNMSPKGASTFNYAAWSRSSSTGGGSYNNTTLTLDQVLANATYFQFTITPNAGQTITIDSLSLDCMAGTATTSTDREFFLLSSATGYADTDVLLAGGTQPAIGGYTFTTPIIPLNNSTIGDQNYSVDLSGNSAFADLTGPVSFRIYIGTDTVSQNLGFSQLTVDGTVSPVPEPSTGVLLGLGGGFLALLAGSRRRSQA